MKNENNVKEEKSNTLRSSLKSLAYFLKFENYTLFSFSSNASKVLLIGGWIIFALWLISLYALAINFRILLFLGFIWANLGFWVWSLALLFLIIYFILNLHKLHLSILGVFSLLILNVLSLILIFIVLNKTESKVFVLFENDSKINSLDINFIKDKSVKHLGVFDFKDKKIFNYEPKIKIIDARKYQEPENKYLEIKILDTIKLINFPDLTIGNCYKVILTDKFELEKRRRIIMNNWP